MDVTSMPFDRVPDQEEDVVPQQQVEGVTPTPEQPAPQPTKERTWWDTAQEFIGVRGALGVIQAARGVLTGEGGDIRGKEYKGKGEITKLPNADHVQTLRKNQNDPEAIEGFDSVFGAGASARYLNVAKKEDVDTLLKNKDNPEAIEGFNAVYGEQMAKYYIPLFDPKSDGATKLQAGLDLRRILSEGASGLDNLGNSGVGEVAGSIIRGAEQAGGELVQSGASLVDTVLGADTKQAVEGLTKEDTRSLDNPMTNAIASGLSQFITGFVTVNAVTPGAGLAGAARWLRAMGVGGLTDALAFDPNDPLIGNGIAALEKHMGWEGGMLTSGIKDIFDINKYESEAAKRTMRAVEGTALGLVLEAAILLGRATKAVATKGARQEAEALRLKEEAATKLEEAAAKEAAQKAEWEQIQRQREAERVYDGDMAPQVQRELPLEGGSNFPRMGDEQLTFDMQPRWGEANPNVDIGQRFDMPTEPRLDQLDWVKQQGLRAARDIEEMEKALLDKWKPPSAQIEMELPSVATRPDVGVDNFRTQTEMDFNPPRNPLDEYGPAQRDPTSTFDPPTAVTRNGPELFQDLLSDIPRGVRDVVETVRPPTPIRNPDIALRQLLREVPDFTNRTFDEVMQKVGPVVDDVINLGNRNIKEVAKALSEQFSVDEMKKLSAMVNAGSKRITGLIDEVNSEIQGLISVGRGAEADRLQHTLLRDLVNQKARFDTVDGPLGSIASDLLNMRRIQWDMVNAKANRVRVSDLRAEGFSDREIAQMISDALRDVKIDTKPLDALKKARDEAIARGNAREVALIEQKIGREIDRLTKEGSSTFSKVWNTAVDSLVEFKLNAMLSGLKTMFVINTMSAVINVVSRTIGEFIGQSLHRGVRDAATITSAKIIGAKAGHQGMIEALFEITKKGAKAFRDEQSSISGSGRFEEGGYTKAITAERWGLNPEGILGKAVDTAGGIVRTPGRVLMFNDEFLGTMIAKGESGAEAAIRFLDRTQTRMKDIKGILKDPQLDKARKVELEKELHALKSDPRIEVEVTDPTGKKTLHNMTKDEYIEHSVKNAFDETGVLKDANVSRMTDEVLLKDEFTGKIAKNIEGVMTNRWVKLTMQPFYRTPIRAIQRGFEFMPVLGKYISPQYRADLQGLNGPRKQAIAQGKAWQGWALVTAALYMTMEGRMTGTGPTDWKERRTWENAGWGGNLVKIGDKWVDVTSLDPLTTIFKTVATLYQNYKLYDLRSEAEGMAYFNEIMVGMIGSIAQSLTDGSMLTGISQTLTLVKGMTDSSQDADKLSAIGGKWVAGQTSGFVPNLLRSVNELLDPRMVDAMGAIDALQVGLWNKDAVAKQYTVTGRVRENKNPLKSFFGPFAIMSERNMKGKEDFVEQSLANISAITGKPFHVKAEIDGLKADLRTVPSVTGNGTMADTFMKQFGTIKDGNGMNITDRLYALLNGAKGRYAIGNNEVDGKLSEAITKTIGEFKKRAAHATDKIEETNQALIEGKVHSERVQRKALDPRNDRAVPDNLIPRLIK
jgi:hypothetical protein